MTWSGPTTLASGAGNTAATSQSLSGITASAGTFVAVVGAFTVSASTVTGLTFSDSAGNSWIVHSQEIDNTAGAGYGFVAYSILTNALSSGSITVTRTGSGNINRWSFGVISFTGNAASSPEDNAVLATAFGSTSSPAVTGNAATQAGNLLIAVCGIKGGTTLTYTEDAADGWTNIFNALTPSGGFLFMSAAYQVNSGASGIKHSPSLNVSQPWAEIQIGFSPGAASIALAALGSGRAKAGAFLSASGVLSAYGAAQARARFPISAAAAVAARGFSAARGSAASSSSAAISAGAHGSAIASAHALLFATAALSARGMAQALSRSVAAISAALFGRGVAASHDRSKVSASAPIIGDPELLLKTPTVTRLMKVAGMIRSLKVP